MRAYFVCAALGGALCLSAPARAQAVFRLIADTPTAPDAATAPAVAPNAALFAAIAKADVEAARAALNVSAKDAKTLANSVDASGNTPLFNAVSSNSLPMVTLLLEKGADPNLESSSGTPMQRTIDNGFNTEMVLALLNGGARTDLVDREGRSLLSVASSYNRLKDLLPTLKAKGVSLEARDRRGVSPLETAAQSGNVDTVRLLLDNGANPNARDSNGQSPLHLAAQSANLESLTLLLDRKADVNAVNNSGDAPLHLAAMNPNASIAALVQRGANPNLKNAAGDAPLHLALRQLDPENNASTRANYNNYGGYNSYGGRGRFITDEYRGFNGGGLRRVDYALPSQTGTPSAAPPPEAALAELIEKSDVNLRDRFGLTPLMLAVLAREPEVCDAIRERAPRSDSTLKFFDAVARGSASEVTAALTAKPFLLYFRLPNGDTPLHIAALWGTRGVAELLLKGGADAEARNARGQTPLHRCAGRATGLYAKRARSMVALLLDKGAVADARDGQDSTALHRALRIGDPEVVTMLLQHKVDANARDASGQSALHLATQLPTGADTSVAKLLLPRADVNARDSNGTTPLLAAIRGRRLELATMLISNGALPDAPDFGGETPLAIVLNNSNYVSSSDSPGDAASRALAELLLKKGADVNARSNGDSLLNRAISRRDRDLVALLLDYKADINARGPSNYNGGTTPLISAVNNNDPRMVTLLLERGADPKIRSSNGETPLDAAKRNSLKDIIALLEAPAATPATTTATPPATPAITF